MKVKVCTDNGKGKNEIELPSEVFDARINDNLMYSVVKLFLANQRQGTAKVKGRSEVRGGGKKPFRQKGTGRARAGSNTSPIWVRGGKAFGPSPKSYKTNISKKIRRAALYSAFSTRAKEEKIFIIENIKVDQPKTKKINELLKKLNIFGEKNLLIIGENDRNVYLSGRNIKNIQIKPVNEINTYDILNNENVIFSSENLIEKIKEVVKQ